MATTSWLLILQLAYTGQHIALPVGSEQQCREHLAAVIAGEHKIVTLENGLMLPIARGIRCEREDLFEAARGRI